MIRALLLASALIAAMLVVGGSSECEAYTFRTYTATERAAIRAMPIEKRPNRPGHFYGNTVRRLHKLGM